MDCSFNNQDLKNLEEIKEFLDSNNIEYSTEYSNFCLFFDNPDGKRSYEIEYIPSIAFPISYPKFNIEGVDKNFFYNLSVEAENNNSFKMWIKGYEWENLRQKEVLKSYILHAAGKTPNKINGRDCEIRVVEPKIARQFELENCFYGKRGASLSLGLYLKKDVGEIKKDTLVMLYTFGMNFFAKTDSIIEIIRVGTLKFCHVNGGSSKLLKHFINNYKEIQIGKKIINVKQLKFYSDYDHNLGMSMNELGFEFLGYSGGGFMNYWIEDNIVKQREPMRHKWVMEQMNNGKCLAIPNAGVKTYIMNL